MTTASSSPRSSRATGPEQPGRDQPRPDQPRPDQPGSGENQPQIDATGRLGPGTRALVFGGGGSTGNAWLIGIVAGLVDAGLDVTAAELTIGTSAGSTAAAQLAGASPSELYTAILPNPPRPPTQSTGSDAGRRRAGPMPDHLDRLRTLIAAAADAADMRRRVGASALEMATTGEPAYAHRMQAQWRASVAARLPSHHWPEHQVLLTAVDAETGEPVVFDRHSGVDLVDAVAASCAGGGFAYGIGAHWYIDGGYRSNPDNADLAAGHERVLVLSPLGGKSLFPQEWGMQLAAQVENLRAHGSRVETIFPGSTVEHLFGANAMDLSLRPAAAQAGFDQGGALAEQLNGFWR